MPEELVTGWAEAVAVVLVVPAVEFAGTTVAMVVVPADERDAVGEDDKLEELGEDAPEELGEDEPSEMLK